MSFLIFFSYLTLAVWVYLVFFHGRKFLSKETFFWSNKIIFERQYFESNYSTQLKKICVIIPARNEEKTICRTLNSVREQNIKNLGTFNAEVILHPEVLGNLEVIVKNIDETK